MSRHKNDFTEYLHTHTWISHKSLLIGIFIETVNFK